MEKQTQETYSEVREVPWDLYEPFLYGSMVGWLKPGRSIYGDTPSGEVAFVFLRLRYAQAISIRPSASPLTIASCA
jgi:hypothetical protein